MWWARGRDEPHLIELALFSALFCDNQVRDVHGVEGASKDADAHPFLPHHAVLMTVRDSVVHTRRVRVCEVSIAWSVAILAIIKETLSLVWDCELCC
jgi:hypothetical protein